MNLTQYMCAFQQRGRSFFLTGLLIIGGLFGLHIQATHAAVCDFQSVGTSDFNLDANWSCGHQPTAGDVATIRAGTSTIMTASSTFAALNATGTIDALNFNLTVTGNSEVAATGYVTSTSGILNFFGAVSSTGIIGTSTQTGDMFFGSTFQNNGTFNVGAGTATTTDVLTNNMGAIINNNSGTLSVAADFISTGTFNGNTGLFRVVGAATQSIAGRDYYNFLSIKSGGFVNINNASILNTFNVSGTTAVQVGINGLFAIGSCETYISSGSSVTSTSGFLNFKSVSSSGLIKSTIGNMAFTSLTNNGTLLMGGALTTISGDVVNSGVVSSTGATLLFSGAANQSFGGSGSINLSYLTLNKTAGTVTLTGNVTSTNTVTLTSGNLDIGNYRFAALGANYNNTGAVVTVGDSGVLHHPLTRLSFSDSTGGVPAFSFQNGSLIYVGISAPARNLSALVKDSFTIPITTAAGAGSDAETITLTETGVASGLFVNGSNFFLATGTVTPGNGHLDISASGLATAAYTNVYDPSDTSSTTATMNAAALSSNVDNNTGGGGAIGSSGSSSLPPLVTQNQSGPSGSAANLNNLKTLGISIHALVKLPDDGKASTQEDSAVYYIGTDGMRHAFPNSKIYFTWYTDFSQVQLVSATQLASIPLGKNVTYKPGVRMVKFTTDPKVYAVDKGGVLRYVTTEAVATALYGSAWNTMIDDLSDAFFTNYTFGTNISSGADFNPSALKASVKLPSESLGM